MNRTKHFSVREIAYIALFVALMTVCAWISIPMGEIAFTMQTFAVFVTAGLLGTRRAGMCILAYTLIGAVGVPVFSNFTGGMGILFGATGGYIVGFIFSALVAGALLRRVPDLPQRWKVVLLQGLAMFAGLIVCYAFGTIWFLLVYAPGTAKHFTVFGVLSTCVIPYILPDVCKIVLALALTRRLSAHIRL